MEWIAESVLDALNDFERKPELSPMLEEYLKRIAKNGEIVFPWCKLKPVLKRKLDVVLDEFYDSYPVETSVPVPNFETFNFDSLKKTILQAVDSFTSAPFTIQRLCELVTNPQEHYNRIDKYMRGIEKNVLVVSTVEPRSSAQGDGNNANINPIMNGIVSDSPRDDNDTLNGHESTDSVTSSNLNTASNHVLLENFANVFPSAACIPSASNICINREIDNNFMGSSECVETHEIEFDAPPTESRLPETIVVPKEEDMDTTEDDQANVSSDSSEVTSCDSESPEHSDVSEPEKAPESTVNQPDPTPVSSDPLEEVAPVEALQNEAESHESHTEAQVTDTEATETVKCQQDDTVSQSDNDPQTSTAVPQTSEVVVESEAPCEVESPAEPISEAPSQSTLEIESSDQSMELESSTNSEEPPV